MCFRPPNATKPARCPHCGTFNKPNATVCAKCGFNGDPNSGDPALKKEPRNKAV